uniref:Uncharacterized protein n=1 Tax=Lepeophtheirus salmonis TaxID=72036 RepID=A0A0K2T530_LEPSM
MLLNLSSSDLFLLDWISARRYQIWGFSLCLATDGS